MHAGTVHKKTMRGASHLGLAAIVASVCLTAMSSGSAQASEPHSGLACLLSKEAIEVVLPKLLVEPSNGATVPTGMPAVLSTEFLTSSTPTFSVASSPTLLSNPDIDSGTGVQSDSFFRFSSTRATATPRTIYWTASFTLIPGGCETPSTFTTAVQTLIVVPSEAEIVAVKRNQEQEAIQKKLEEEAAAKKLEAEVAAAGIVVLNDPAVNVERGRDVAVSLTCADVAPCTGTLTLTVSPTGKGRAHHAATQTIGTTGFSIGATKDTAIKLPLNKTGRALLSAAHGHLSATLTILKATPLPSNTQKQHIHLTLQRATAKK